MDSDESHEAYAARVRDALRVAINDGSPAAALASAAGVTAAALYDFIAEGSTVRPYRRTLASYERVLTGLDGPSPPVPLPGNGGDGEIVPVPATTLAYWRGRFDTMAEWAHALDAMMQQQREQFARFTQGVSDFRESGVLSPSAPRLAQTADEAEAIVQELREAKARAAPGASGASGATPGSVPAAARKA